MSTICNQKGCEEPGAYRFIWPGNDEATVCEGHAPKLRAVASVLGFYLHMIPLTTKGDDDGRD